jgi:hypothetical protein
MSILASAHCVHVENRTCSAGAIITFYKTLRLLLVPGPDADTERVGGGKCGADRAGARVRTSTKSPLRFEVFWATQQEGGRRAERDGDGGTLLIRQPSCARPEHNVNAERVM